MRSGAEVEAGAMKPAGGQIVREVVDLAERTQSLHLASCQWVFAAACPQHERSSTRLLQLHMDEQTLLRVETNSDIKTEGLGQNIYEYFAVHLHFVYTAVVFLRICL